MKKKIFFLSIIVLIFSSCSQRSLKYIQDKKQDRLDTITEYTNQPPNYKIQPYDVLYIKVTTTNQEINELFSENVTSNYNTTNNSYGGSGNEASSYFTGFMVTDSGWVKVPLLGDFNVKDKTIDEIEFMVSQKVNELLIDAIVKVKLISFKIFYLGEFNFTGSSYSSGSYTFYQKNVSLLEAVAAMGGINDYGDKRKLMIIRKTLTGYQVFRVDLTDRHILEATNFYLQPNDMIYVEPIKSKSFQLAVQDYSTAITLITSTITTVLLIINLKK